MEERRRWGRIKVPESKLSCRIEEPGDFSGSNFIVDNINPGGLCFISDKSFIENTVIKLMIKFPFTSYEEAGTVWGKVTYCLKIHDQSKFIVGIGFVRKKRFKLFIIKKAFFLGENLICKS